MRSSMKFSREKLLAEYARITETTATSFADVFGYLFCIAAHVFYLIMFSLMHVPEMVVFNCFSVPFYIALLFLGRKPKLQDFLVYASTFEIIIHASLATYLVGWSPGFNIFLLMVMPTSFFMPNKRLYMPYVVSFVAMSAYGFLRLHNDTVRYEIPEQWMATMTYGVNVVTGMCTMFYSSTLYMLHSEYLKHKLELQNKTLQDLALFDPLTHLYNRRAMNEYLLTVQKECSETGRCYAAAICDVDNFKRVNDTYGHAAGDEVLEYVAQVFQKHLPAECHTARWGGEEFLFILPDTGLEAAAGYAEQLHQAMRGHIFHTEQGDFSVTMTVGISTGSAGADIEKVIAAADALLYQGKNSGKNRTVLETDQ